jgi:hypothetical protein
MALILAPALCVTSSASAEIFKCVAKDGTALYQNFPCKFDSIGWVPPNPQAANGASMPPAAAASQAKPKVAPVNTGDSVNDGLPHAGMTPDEIRTMLGEPLEIVQDDANETPIEIWRYIDKTIKFDRSNRVVAVEPTG